MKPAVNEECEYTFKALNEPDYCKWDRCTVMYLSKHGVVIKEAWGAEAFFAYEHYDVLFRPIQSEKETSINEIAETIHRDHWIGMPTPKGIAETVWDLGYRKTMSREEANAVISEAMLDIPISVRHRTSLLDALGY